MPKVSSGIGCGTHMVANSCRGCFTVLGIETSSIHNTQNLTVLGVFDGIQKFDPSISIWLHEGIMQYHWILPNTIRELGFTTIAQGHLQPSSKPQLEFNSPYKHSKIVANYSVKLNYTI